MKWVTRERPKVDRIACPWLIKRFVDPEAEFLYVPADQVQAVAEAEGAPPYDVSGAELGHYGEECSFDAILHKYQLDEKHPALRRLARIVRGADTSAHDLTPESWGAAGHRPGLQRRLCRRPRATGCRATGLRRAVRLVPGPGRHVEPGRVMLVLRGSIDLPAHAAGGFDHGDVHLVTGRVFVAHTPNDTVDVLDGHNLAYAGSIQGRQRAAGHPA